MPPPSMALLAQVLAVMLVLLIVAAAPALAQGLLPGHLHTAMLQGGIAAVMSRRLGMAVWWLPIQFVFAPGLVLTLSLDLPSIWFLGAFLLLALVYGRTYQTQVPLYLSSRTTIEALASLLPKRDGFSFIDLGSGFGGLLRHLSRIRPDGDYHGIEAAPLPFLLSKCRNVIGAGGGRIRWGNFWRQDLSPYDVVYAYLSPVPMTALWRKAHAEMRPGSIFISNSFTVAGVTPEMSLKLEDFEGSTLHVWRM